MTPPYAQTTDSYLPIVMPDLGLTDSTATVSVVLREPEDLVSSTDAIFHLVSGPVCVELGAQTTGIVTNVLVEEGDEVAVGELLADVTETGFSSSVEPF